MTQQEFEEVLIQFEELDFGIPMDAEFYEEFRQKMEEYSKTHFKNG